MSHAKKLVDGLGREMTPCGESFLDGYTVPGESGRVRYYFIASCGGICGPAGGGGRPMLPWLTYAQADSVAKEMDCAFLAGQRIGRDGYVLANIAELERLIEAIDDLTLPDHYGGYDRHLDAVCRAGIKGIIRDRIAELSGDGVTRSANTAEQLAATTSLLADTDSATGSASMQGEQTNGATS